MDDAEDRRNKRATQQRIRRNNMLVKQASELAAQIQPHERICRGKVKLRDEAGEVLRDEAGVVMTRPCKNKSIRGGFVCPRHGGRAPQVKKAAARRLLAMVEPSIIRLDALIHQDIHLPTSLAAIRTVLERAGDEAIGALKTGVGEKDMRPIINIGIKVGGIDAPTVKVGILGPAQADLFDAPIDADLVEDDGGNADPTEE